MTDFVDLDSIVDYQSEYKSVLQKIKKQGPYKITSLCPFHNDSNPSFSVDLKKGLFKCFSCGMEGNFIDFESHMKGITTQEAYKQILERYHVSTEVTYTVEDYAYKKRLPLDFLTEKFHLTSCKEKNGDPYIKIPYFSEAGKEVLFRKRYKETAPVRFKWKYGCAGKLLMYGEQYLPAMREKKQYAVLVEGESDTQTLLFLGIPALGVPGATVFSPQWAAKFKGIDKIYLHIEPDAGGQTFLTQMTQKLKEGGYKGKVYKFSCWDIAAKDPSEVLVQHGKDAAKAKIEELIEGAKEIDLNNIMDSIPAAIADAPIKLRQPEGWIYSEKGIAQIDEKTAQPVTVCRTPIIITKRLRSIETGDEKIEVAFKRDGAWHKAIQSRSTIFQAKFITTLADLGCTVTSENAKMVVRFLEKLEAENIDIIPKEDSASTFGWQDEQTFLPGLADGITLDIEPSLRGWAAAYSQSGTYADWKAMVTPHRERDRFRFILAAAFTAPLLRIIRQRIFFVYNWGGSKGGKSAALKAALSAWGDPDKLMVNFNATQVALERMAGFYCDLPLGLDERQLAGSNQGSLERTVYMLASGTGRVRGSKTGGLQALQTWRTVVLSTGEEPIATDTSQTGINTRIIEIYGAPFNSEKDAGLMHQTSNTHYGWAGIDFVKRLIKLDEDEVRLMYARMTEYVYAKAEGRNSSHISGIAAVAMADALASEWIFGENAEAAWERAKQMADTIVSLNAENSMTDVNENAAQFIADWIDSNVEYFTGKAYGTKYGEIEGDIAYVYPTLLGKALKDAGYSERKTLKYLAEQNVIGTTMLQGVMRYKVRKKVYGTNKVQWYIKINMEALRMAPEERKAAGAQIKIQELEGFTRVDYDDIPF